MNEKKRVQKASEETKNSIKRKSAHSLPVNPSERGWKPDEIKRAFYAPITETAQSVLAEQDRIVSEVNEALDAHDERMDSQDEATKAALDRIVSEVNEALDAHDEATKASLKLVEETSATALDKANDATEKVAEFREEIGTEDLITGGKTVKASVNEAVNTANMAKTQSDTVRTNLINLSAQVQGIGRTYVVSDFTHFIDFLNGNKSIELKEDRDGNGVVETYNIYIGDLKSGDNIIIVEKGVPDFWFEKNSAISVFDTYQYNGEEYSLSAKSGGVSIGRAHILETDYTVIEGYATSSAASASDAKEAEQSAKSHSTSALLALQNAETLVNQASSYAANAAESERLAAEHTELAVGIVDSIGVIRRVEGETLHIEYAKIDGETIVL